jgi:large subunit ribosomal protein L25
MDLFEIKGSLRTEKGKKFAKKLRKEELVPAVLYGGKESILLSVVERDLRELIYTPNIYQINLNIGKKKRKAIVKEIQFHPVSDKVLHIDFLEIFDDKKITMAIPIKLVGSAEGAKQGGKLALIKRKLRVCGYPNDLPGILEIDVTSMGLGKSKLVEEIMLDNIDIVEPKGTVIASVKLTRAARGAQAATETPAPSETA